jgi:hypothetical protein
MGHKGHTNLEGVSGPESYSVGKAGKWFGSPGAQ